MQMHSMADTEREAVALQEEERWSEALAAWVRLLKLDPQHVLAPRGVVMALCRLDRLADAEGVLLKPQAPLRKAWWAVLGRRRSDGGQPELPALLPGDGEAGAGWTEAAVWYFRFLAVQRAAQRKTAFIDKLTAGAPARLLYRLAVVLTRFNLIGAADQLFAALPVETDGEWERLAQAWRSFHSGDLDSAALALADLLPDARRHRLGVELTALLAANNGDVRGWQDAVLELDADGLPPGFMNTSIEVLARKAATEDMILRLQDLPESIADAAFRAGVEVTERLGLLDPEAAAKLAKTLMTTYSDKIGCSSDYSVLMGFSGEGHLEVDLFPTGSLPPPLSVLRQMMMAHRPAASLGQYLSSFIASASAKELNEALLLKARHCLVWGDREGALAALRGFDPEGEVKGFGFTFNRFLPDLVHDADSALIDALIPILLALPSRTGIRTAGMISSTDSADLGLAIARRLIDHPDLKPFEGVWLGDFFVRHYDYSTAAEMYQWVRQNASEPMEGLSTRLRRCLYHDPALNRALMQGDDAAVRTHLNAQFDADELDAAAFTMVPVVQSVALSQRHGWPHEEVIPGREVNIPPSLYFGRPEGEGIVVRHPAVYWAELRGARVSPNSAAVLVNGVLVHPPAEAPNAARYIHADGTIAAYSTEWAVVSQLPVTRRLDAAVSLLGAANNNYYHWMFDICSRFLALRHYEAPEGAVLLVDDLAMRIPQIRETIDRLNRWNLPLVTVPGNESFVVERLAVAASGTWGPFHLYDHLDLELADVVVLAEAVQALRMLGEPEVSRGRIHGGRRIYITRVGAANPRIANDAAISEFLREHMGFEIVDPGTMSFAQQVEVFADASVVVGATGAALTNTVFCSPGVKILCLIVSDFNYSAWPMVAQAVGGDMMFLSGKVTEKGFNKYHHKFEIELSSLKDALSLLLSR